MYYKPSVKHYYYYYFFKKTKKMKKSLEVSLKANLTLLISHFLLIKRE